MKKKVNINTKDIILEKINLSVPNKQLLIDTDLKIANKRKYGLIGNNGIGKSTLLKAIATRELNIPKNIDIFYVDQEVILNSSKTAFQVVLEANTKREKWMKRYEENKDKDGDDPDLKRILEKLKNMDIDKDNSRVHQILHGLGFEYDKHNWTTDKFSGGWRMRLSLAKAIFMTPTCLLLDEPSAHLDLNGVIYLTDTLKKWKKTLLIVSHDRNFLNEVCTDIIHLENKKLTYYSGNYDLFLKQYDLNIKSMEKEWKKVQNKVNEMRKKSLPKKQVDDYLKLNLNKEPPKIYNPRFRFPEFEKIDKILIGLENVSFGYDARIGHMSGSGVMIDCEAIDHNKILFEDISLDIKEGTRYVLVGKNGVGKSTLMKLMANELQPTKGYVNIDTKARIGYYHQHSSDVLPLNKTPVEYMNNLKTEEARALLGSVGLMRETHMELIGNLSGGQKARVALVEIISKKPNVLLLDEITNNLDIITITNLINSLKTYQGAIVIITHNLDLIEELDCQLLEIENNNLYLTDIDMYFEKVLFN